MGPCLCGVSIFTLPVCRVNIRRILMVFGLWCIDLGLVDSFVLSNFLIYGSFFLILYGDPMNFMKEKILD